MKSSLILFELVFLICVGVAVGNKQLGSVSFECGNVFLSVSSLSTSKLIGNPVKENEIELNWDFNCQDVPAGIRPNWIGLFSANPSTTPNQDPLVYEVLQDGEHQNGYLKTVISFGKPYFPNGWNKRKIGTSGDEIEELNDYESPDPSEIKLGPECMGYWIASYHDEILLKVDCIKIQPSWMYDHRNQIGKLPLAQLFIPGTHNSGCFYKGYPQKRDTFQRFVLTQDRDIWAQLVHGIRYLDFRIGFYPTTKENTTKNLQNSYKSVSNFMEYVLNLFYTFPTKKKKPELWLNHDLIRVTPLLPLIRDIRRFMELSKQEIVILDIHRFPVGFTNYPDRHQILLDLLQQELSHLILPRFNTTNDYYPTLNDIWHTTDRRLIITYGDDEIVKNNRWLWYPVRQFWGNEQTTSGLKQYMQKTITSDRGRARNPIWALMAQLTPTPVDVMFKPTGSLRVLADEVNRNLTMWLRTKWWKNVNVIASDFFMGNNLIDVAINANMLKAHN